VSKDETGEPGAPVLDVVEAGFVDLFPELEDGTDLGIIEYFPPGSEALLVDLIGEVHPGAA
jgi:hypothetical protein